MSNLESQLNNTLLPLVLVNIILKYTETSIRVEFINKTVIYVSQSNFLNFDCKNTIDMDIYGILILTNPISKFKNSKIQTINGNVVLIGDVSNMFCGARYFSSDDNSNFSISDWDTTNVTDMSCMFKFATRFDSDISGWNTSNVTNMSYMFYEAITFASDLSGWNTSNVKYMRFMFNGAEKFNSDVNNNLKIRCWNTSKVISISYMFSEEKKFNLINKSKLIRAWNISSVTHILYIF